MEKCPLCQSKDLVRPPAYEPMTLTDWCSKRSRGLSSIIVAVPRRGSIVTENDRVAIARERMAYLRRAELLGRMCEAQSGKLISPFLDQAYFDRVGSNRDESDDLSSEGRGNYDPVGIAEESQERREWEARRGIDNTTKVDEIIHEVRKEESPNVEKRFTVVKPGELDENSNST